jgi:hypothetical protein
MSMDMSIYGNNIVIYLCAKEKCEFLETLCRKNYYKTLRNRCNGRIGKKMDCCLRGPGYESRRCQIYV